MNETGRSIFRAEALRRYMHAGDRPVLPRSDLLHTFLALRILLGALRWIPFRSALQALTARLWRRRVPVVLQMSQVECGAACLAMVLTHFGRRTSIAECREQCGAGRDGVTALTIARAARAYGLRVKAYSLEPATFQHVPLPAVVHWNFNHFVVVERWSPGQVEIVDPAAGRRSLTADEFDASFTGVVLTFEPGANLDRHRTVAQKSGRSYLASMLQARGARGLLVQVLGASLLLQVLGLALPFATVVLVDHVLPARITGLMAILGIGMALLVLTQLVISYVRAALLMYLQQRVDTHMMLGFFEHLLALPFGFFAQRTSGDLLMRLGSHGIIREILTGETLSAVLDGSLVLAYLAILLTQDPRIGILALGLGLIQAALILGTARRAHGLMQRHLVAQAASQSYLFEALAGIATVKASGAEDRALDRWSGLFTAEMNVSLQRSHLSALVDSGLSALRILSPLLLLWVGAYWVLDGTLSLGTMLALTALAGAFLAPLASLLANVQQLQLVGAHLERLTDVLEAEPEQGPQTVSSTPRLTGRFELRNVSFRYDPSTPWVLQDISVAIEPGQKVALVGPTGSGKSTLGLLLLGLYPPTEGEVLYDDTPLQRLNYRALRSQFGVVLQEPFLFNDSIRRNIAFTDPDLSLDTVIEAARSAAIHDEIEQMPMGYETRVAEGGGGLSGGQIQRIAIARALAQAPAVLLLDEATSHLDVVTERLVDQNLSARACTRIVIAHRLSTIRSADVILVLDRGRIVERGTHEELLARGGHYADLVHGQLQEGAVRAPS